MILGWAYTIGLLILLWLLVSIPAYWLLSGWQRIGTETPAETARWFFRYIPNFAGHYANFKARWDAAVERLGASSVRVMVDRKHRQLRRDLTRIRANIDRCLQQISAASAGHEGGTLIDLLRGFQSDTQRALQFGTIEDGFVDDTVARSKARFSATTAVIFMFVITAANFGLLYLFFDEFFAGLRVPYIGIQLALALALAFPIVEAAGGFAGEMLARSEAGRAMTTVGLAVIVLVVIVLGALEFVIFYQLLGPLFQAIRSFPRDGLMHMAVSFVGPAFTALEAIFGFIATRNLLRLRELSAHISIRDQISDAREFVDGLESRYGRIDRAAAAAIQSIDELECQFQGRRNGEIPVASTLAEQREALKSAINDVDPERWAGHVPAGDGDRAAVTTQAWILPLLIIAALAFFSLVAGWVLARSGIAGRYGFWIDALIALVTASSCLLAGAHLFDRTTVAYDTGSEWRDAIAPRDSAFPVAALAILATAAAGTTYACIAADGWTGIAAALLLVAVLIGVAIAGSYLDLAARGFSFLITILPLIALFALSTLALGGWATLLIAAGIIAAAIHAIVALLAWPLTWLLSLRRSPAPAATATA